jgi:hypothetical protein
MILKKSNSRVYTINLFSDFLLTKISTSEESIFSVVDCHNFIIIKGKTTHKEILDISSITKEFNEKYELSQPISRTIDLIEYDCKLSKVKNLEFILHKSENCSYHKTQIEKFLSSESSFDFNGYPIKITDDKLVIASEFPHGYSLNQGRLIYLYGKHIFYNIPTNYISTSIIFNLSLDKNEENENIISIFNVDKNSEDEKLKSAILDVFDFDMSSMSSKMKKVDWSIELTNPLEEYSFIKKKNKDFIIF